MKGNNVIGRLIMFFSFLLVPQFALGQIDFQLRNISPSTVLPDHPLDVYAADFDGDGDNDVLCASNGDKKVIWYENIGNALFAGHVIANTANGVISVIAMDLDDDADIDVASAAIAGGQIAWYENDGKGNFTTHFVTHSAGNPRSVYAANIDFDSDMDFLSASPLSSAIRWYDNQGNGNFIMRTINNNANGATSVFAIDLDNDGDNDVLSAATNNNQIAWYRNNGLGSFVRVMIDTDAEKATNVFAIDLDQDLDIDVLASFADQIVWYENDGDENFTRLDISTDANLARDVYAADLDNDNDLDILSASDGDNKIAWYENDGNQNFTPYIVSTSVYNANSVFASDLNGDGYLDIIAPYRNGWPTNPYERIGWFENDRAGSFIRRDIGHSASAVDLIDIDDDNDIDIFTASYVDNRISWFENDGKNSYERHIIHSNAKGVIGLQMQDIDGDGDNDIILASDSDGKVSWFENDGSINFTPNIITTEAEGIRNFVVSDIDFDGDPDILAAIYGSWPTWNSSINMYINDGNGNFTTQVIDAAIRGATSVYAKDLDNDDDIDILSTSWWDSEIVWYENTGNSSFSRHLLLSGDVTKEAIQLEVHDVDGDGDQDIIGINNRPPNLNWFSNDGNQNFTLQSTLNQGTTFNTFKSFFTKDIDQDNDIDIFTTGRMYLNDGNGQFVEHPVDDLQNIRSIGDVDGDNDYDIVFSDNSTLNWLENLSPVSIDSETASFKPRTFSLANNYPNPFNPQTQIDFTIPANGVVNLSIYNLLGQEVAELISGTFPAGNHSHTFNATDLPSGIYIYRLGWKGSQISKKMILIR